ncbi:hypothetical protein [Rhizobium sp. BK661]|uniref:hypothetical protein n=1 Tax=Rhizobium sp. BK661 TaxID=2586991 RepID=UPI002169F532|nr:hypothetical protein [Rhizobium sp. BK661]MCS3744446.1 IS605 OrfB family transposase [Rhizobium sp. BK661]
MFRTFQTRLRLTDSQFEALNAYAACVGKAERTLYARLQSGRIWKGDLSRAFHREVGLGSALTTMLYRQLQARLASARAVAREQRAALNRRLWRECIRLQAKKDRLLKSKAALAALRIKFAAANLKVAELYRTIKTVPKPPPHSIKRLKHAINDAFHLKERSATSLRRLNDLARSLHDLKRRVQKIARRLKRAEGERDKPIARFAPRKLFGSQHFLQLTRFATHDDWLVEWRSRRDSTIFFEGDARAPSGNRCARLTPGTSGSYNLEIRLPKPLGSHADEHFVSKGRDIFVLKLGGLHFNHGQQVVQQTLASGYPISVRLHRDQKSWKISVTISHSMSVGDPDWTRGSLGVDWNANRIVIAHVDRAGNLIRTYSYSCSTRSKTATQNRDTLRKVSARIAELARVLGISVVKEDLDFSAIKASPRAMGDPHFRTMLASFAYGSFDRSLASACARSGVALTRVDPARTTMIGRLKFSRRYGLSVDQAAAFVIARRGMKFSEKLCLNRPFANPVPAESWHPTATREERKACVASAEVQSIGDIESANSARAVFAGSAKTVYRDRRDMRRGDVAPHDPPEPLGCSRSDRLSRTSKGWRVCRNE